MIRKAGGRVLIGLVGVQSNQFPRAVDLAPPRRDPGLHRRVSRLGLHRDAARAAKEIRDTQALGISFFAGEAEDGRLDQVLRDAWAGRLARIYGFMKDLPALQGAP